MNRFRMTNGTFYVTDQIKETFDRDGFIVVKELFNNEEVAKLRECIEMSEDIPKHAIDLSDGKGAKSRLCIWNRAGNDACGVASRLQKVAGTLQDLLGGYELYHYHTKLMMKEPEKGGAFLWHQDYGYWYQNECLTPDMGSVFMPVDRCTKENSCLQVLAGSHKMGRIEHYLIGDQSGADPERVQLAKQRYEHVYIEMEPGDALFFHSNLLHASDQNKSMLRRWVLVTSYNQKRNAPVKKHHHLDYHPLEILPNQALIECTRIDSTIDKAFMDPKDDKSASSLKRKE